MRVLWIPLAAALAIAGCVRLNQPAPRVTDYTITYAAPAPAVDESPLPIVLPIPPIAVSAAFDTHGMMFREGDHRVGRYAHARWAANPGHLVADMIARDFAESNQFRAVQHARAPLASDFRLTGEVEAIEERIGDGRCEANLEIRVLLVGLRGTRRNPVAFRSGYAEREPCPCADADAYAGAVSRALARISTRLRADVVTAIANANSSP